VRGTVVLRRQSRRGESLSFIAKLPRYLIGMGACASHPAQPDR